MSSLLLSRSPAQKALFGVLLATVTAVGVWVGYLAVDSGELIQYFAVFAMLFSVVSIIRGFFLLPYVKVENGELREQWTVWIPRKYRLSEMAEIRMAVSLSPGQSSSVVPLVAMRDGKEVRLASAACKPGSAYHRRVVEFTGKLNDMITTRSGSATDTA